MKSSLFILTIFSLGLAVGFYNAFPDYKALHEAPIYILYLLMFLVGISLGTDKNIAEQIKKIDPKLLLIPCATVGGTFLGVFLYSIIFNFPEGRDLYAIGAGFGYYSFSGIYISKVSGEVMGIIALIANITREVITLILAPLLVKFFGKIAPITAGGATTSDTTLPVIVKFSGNEYIIGSVFHGVVLTLLVPVIISFIYSL